MSSHNTKSERFELRLRPNIAAEADLLAELEAQDGVYGGKTELLRECLRRGFTALGAAVDSQPADASEDDVLASLASAFQSGEYSYRIGKLFLDAREALKTKVVEIPKDPPKSHEATRSEAEMLLPVQTQTSSPPEQDSEASVVPPTPRQDWARFRGVAGKGDNSSGQE